MIDAFGRWFPDFPGQQPYQDPAYYRTGAMRQQVAAQSMPQAVPPMQQPNTPQYTHNTPAPVQGGFVRVQSEQEARAYPVAPGSSITFIDESRPYCYTKSVDMSQLDRPKFDKYRLVKEEDTPAPAPMDSPVSHENAPQRSEDYGMNNLSEYALKSELAEVRGEVDALRWQIETANRKTEKKGVTEDGEPVD